MSIKEGDFVVPGNVINNLESVKSITLKGPGLQTHNEPNSLLVTRAGFLCFKSPNVYWVEGKPKRYYPKKADLVVGIIAKKVGDSYRVDIGSSEYASLSSFAFEGATKKQKPDVQVGDAVYARLLSAHREMEPELVCVDSYFKAGKLGPLSSDGLIINLSLTTVSEILSPNCKVLETLGKKNVFEIAIGMNGKVWIRAKTQDVILKIMNTLLAFKSCKMEKL